MSQSKFAHLSFVSAALLASSVIHGLNPTKIDAASPKTINNIAGNESRSLTVLTQQDLDRFYPKQKRSILDNNYIADNVDRSGDTTNEDELKSRVLRLMSLAFFFLFFVPLGIFYPLFLFYRMLLIKPDESKNIDGVNGILARDEQEEAALKDTLKGSAVSQSAGLRPVRPSEGIPPTNRFPAESEGLAKSGDLLTQTHNEAKAANISTIANPDKLLLLTEKVLDRATVSKLQIAFSPPASQLRQELSKVGSNTDVDVEWDLVRELRQMVAVLIEQAHWTHVSCKSATLPLAKVSSVFNSVSQQERKKIAHQQTNPTNRNRNVTNTEGYEISYSYVVVTIILCTSHATPLFQKINTKKQLLQELIRLGKMSKDSVIKFELLWNPQQLDKYISNDRLLIDYGDMTRLL